jgi:hypothetical protein
VSADEGDGCNKAVEVEALGSVGPADIEGNNAPVDVLDSFDAAPLTTGEPSLVSPF